MYPNAKIAPQCKGLENFILTLSNKGFA